MSPKKQTRLSGNFVRAVEQELANPERDAVAIMSLNLGCPHDLFVRTQAHLLRETVALLPASTPAVKTMDILADRIIALTAGTVSELMHLVNDPHHSLIVLEVKHPGLVKFCMSLAVAKPGDRAQDLLERAHDMLDAAVMDFS